MVVFQMEGNLANEWGVWIRDWKGTGLVCDALTPGLAGLSLINQQILWTIVF
jgi:hypothetical protein